MLSNRWVLKYNIESFMCDLSFFYELLFMCVYVCSEAPGHDNPVFMGGSPKTKTRTLSQILTRQPSESGRHLLSDPGTPLSPPAHGDVFFPSEGRHNINLYFHFVAAAKKTIQICFGRKTVNCLSIISLLKHFLIQLPHLGYFSRSPSASHILTWWYLLILSS